MSSVQDQTSKGDVPAHVPPDLVVAFDQLNGPEISHFPPTAALEAGGSRPVFYSSLYGGFWVFTRYEDVRLAYQSPHLFKQWSQGIPAAPFSKLYKPLYLDPPDHRPWRKVLTPIFSTRQLARLESFIREVVRERLAVIGPAGRCEFIADVAGPVAGSVFCKQLGLPNEEYARFGRMADDMIFGPAQALKDGLGVEGARAARVEANRRIDEFIAELIPARRREPGDDIISILLAGEVDGRALQEDEIVTLTTLLFFAGTDSTRSAMAYALLYLAQHPDLRDRLVADPRLARAAAHELLRFHGFHLNAREVTEDTEFAGVQLRQGDLVVLSTGAANRDPAKFADPERVDFERPLAHSHLTFGAGVHRCIGSHLATLQLRIVLQEVHRVIVDYRLDPDAGPATFTGGQGKAVPEQLHLAYTPVGVAAVATV
jgi:cytochrome P450